jgi:mutator protein MutT
MKILMEKWRRFAEEKAETARQFSSFVIIINSKNQFLLLKRKSKKDMTFSGLWSFPGGGAEKGEDPEAAVRRESMEETGIKISEIEQIHTKDKENKRIYYFKCLKYSGAVEKEKVMDEHDDFVWIGPNEFDQYHTVPGMELIIRKAYGRELL